MTARPTTDRPTIELARRTALLYLGEASLASAGARR
jgi:hypothetical protein